RWYGSSYDATSCSGECTNICRIREITTSITQLSGEGIAGVKAANSCGKVNRHLGACAKGAGRVARKDRQRWCITINADNSVMPLSVIACENTADDQFAVILRCYLPNLSVAVSSIYKAGSYF